MKRFFIEFLVDAPISIGTRLDQQTKVPALGYKIALRNAEAVIFDAIAPPSAKGVRLSRGLGVHILLDSPNPSDAQTVGKEIAEVILTYLSFGSASSCPPVRLTRMYDATLGEMKRMYREWFTYDVPGTIQQADQFVVQELLRAVDASNDPAVVRALALLRRGLSEDNYFDQFMDYWMALEVLNRDLQALLPKQLVYPERPYDKGIMRLFLQILHWRHRKYRALKSTRDGLFHGTEHHTRHFTKRVADYIPALRKAAITGLCSVLKLPEMLRNRATNQEICVHHPMRLICEVLIDVPAPPDLHDFGKQPFLQMPKPQLDFGLNENGSLHVQFAQAVGKIELHNGTRCDSNLKLIPDIGPRRKNLKGVHRRGDGTEEILTPPN